MPDLADSLPVDELFDYRGTVGRDESAAPLWLPHNQGDVFAQVERSPGDFEPLAMIFQHPCTMRRGPILKPRVVMVRVIKLSTKLKDQPEFWRTRYSEIPLPGLDESEPVTTYKGDLLEFFTINSAELARSKRIAALSSEARLQFQQRVIHYLTRLLPSINELAEATSDVEAEISLQGVWAEAAVDSFPGADIAEAIEAAEREFDDFMRDADRRPRLSDAATQHQVNAEVQREIGARYN